MSSPNTGYDVPHGTSDSHQYIHSFTSGWASPGATMNYYLDQADATGFLSTGYGPMPQSIIDNQHLNCCCPLYINQNAFGTHRPLVQPGVHVHSSPMIPDPRHTNIHQSLPGSGNILENAQDTQARLDVLNKYRPDHSSSASSDLRTKATVNATANSRNESQEVNAQCLWAGCTDLRGFSRDATLWRHIKAKHLYRGSLECPVCAKRFDRPDSLQAHQRLKGHLRT
ncbi:hypothetical protein N7528_007341 [Penicillium herquei]|nr:hypothetical protein N7528_007341 [Penicillium herquei]